MSGINAAIGSAVKTVASWTLPNLCYNGSYYAAKGVSMALGLAADASTSLLTTVKPEVGATAVKTQNHISQLASKLDVHATNVLMDTCYPDFSAAELTGPVIATLGSGWMAARSLHRAVKGIQMLVTGERAEMLKTSQIKTQHAVVTDHLFVPRSTSNLMLSIPRDLILTPLFAGIGYYTEQGIANGLAEVGARSLLPVPYLTVSAAVVYTLVQVYSYWNAKEATPPRVEMLSVPVDTDANKSVGVVYAEFYS